MKQPKEDLPPDDVVKGGNPHGGVLNSLLVLLCVTICALLATLFIFGLRHGICR